MKKLFKLINLTLNWFYWRTVVQVPFLRPSNIRIEGKLKLCMASRISIDKNSVLVVKGNLKLKKSKLHLKSSEAAFDNHSTLNETVMSLDRSKWSSSHHLRAFGFLIKMTGTVFSAADNLFFWKAPYYNAWLLSEHSSISIGSNVRIESKVSCDHSRFTTGNNVFLNYGTEVRCHKEITIGSDVLVSYECLIFDTNTHSLDTESRKREIRNGFPNDTVQTEMEQPQKKAIRIGHGAWIGMRAVILKGSSIGNHAIVGTCSVVGGEVPDGYTAVGNPFILKSPKKNE